MNLVELIEGQLKGETIDKLSSLTGASESKIQSAVGAAVPSLLAGLSKMASSGGAGQLASVLGKVTSETHGNPSEVLAAQPGQVAEAGSGLLGSLLGDNAVGGIANALSRFTGIGAGGLKSLLGYITPLALATIGGEYFKGKTPTAQGLSAMFAEQKDNIAHALPSNLSMDSVMGLADTAKAYKPASVAVPTATVGTTPRWLLPLLGLAVLAGIIWYMSSVRTTAPLATPIPPAVPTVRVPDVAALGNDLTGVVDTAAMSLRNIKDEAAAEAALPQLQQLNAKIDTIKNAWDRLPASAQTSLSSVAGMSVDKLKDTANSVLAIPGVGEKIRPAVEAMLSKLSAMSPATTPM